MLEAGLDFGLGCTLMGHQGYRRPIPHPPRDCEGECGEAAQCEVLCLARALGLPGKHVDLLIQYISENWPEFSNPALRLRSNLQSL